MTHISQREKGGISEEFLLEMLSNECFQGTRNAEPTLSRWLVPGKPHPPGPGQPTDSLLETRGPAEVRCQDAGDRGSVEAQPRGCASGLWIPQLLSS